MVKFQKRMMKQRKKKKQYGGYPKYRMDFPVKVNLKIKPHENKNFDEVDITSTDTPKQEILNIQLARNKTPEEISEQKTD